MSESQFTLGGLAKQLEVECKGDPATIIEGLATLSAAKPGDLAFLSNSKYRKSLSSTKASAVILDEDSASDYPSHCLVSSNPYLTYAKASHLFENKNSFSGVHPSAVVSKTAKLGKAVNIGANCVIGEEVAIGDHTSIGAGSVIGDNCHVGSQCVLYASVTLYHDITIGDQVIIHSQAVLGSDGFGFAPDVDGNWTKIAQLGGVRVGHRVEIGASTTIDRGALDDTIIGDGVILDNQIQIAHNVQIGKNTAIAACCGIAGSTVIGESCTISGAVTIVGHISIVDNTHITFSTVVTKSITEPGSYSSGSPMQDTHQWRKNAVRTSQLDDIYKRLSKLEK